VARASLSVSKMKRTPALRTVWVIRLFVLQLVLLPALVHARTASQEQTRQPLGSLSAVGQVYVGNSVVPAESTIFTGDTLRTDSAATATFTMSGQGSFAIASGSQLTFTGSQQYVAELKSGIVVMNSEAGTSGINLRAGNYVVVAVTRGEQSAAKIESAEDGSFLISCSEGSVGIVPLHGAPNGVFLQKGQSITISSQGELSSPTEVSAATPTGTPNPTAPASPTKTNHTALIVLGVAGGAGAIAGIAAATAGHGGSSVSPSSP
jgi:phage gp45-like